MNEKYFIGKNKIHFNYLYTLKGIISHQLKDIFSVHTTTKMVFYDAGFTAVL